jgi:hypothetical protein
MALDVNSSANPDRGLYSSEQPLNQKAKHSIHCTPYRSADLNPNSYKKRVWNVVCGIEHEFSLQMIKHA